MNYACEHYWRNVIKLEALLLVRQEIYRWLPVIESRDFYFEGEGAGFKKSEHVPRPASQPTERTNYPATIMVELITPDNAAPAPCSRRLRDTVLTTRLLLLFVLLLLLLLGAMT